MANGSLESVEIAEDEEQIGSKFRKTGSMRHSSIGIEDQNAEKSGSKGSKSERPKSVTENRRSQMDEEENAF